jgi:DNA integrity scanning protein DisA with diadenylate cyclase activity
LEARYEARALLKHPDPDVAAGAQRIIDLLTKAIRAMGREDVGALQVIENSEAA